MKLYALITASLLLFVSPALAVPITRAKLCENVGYATLGMANAKNDGMARKDILAKHAWPRNGAAKEVRILYDGAINAAFTSTQDPNVIGQRIYDACMGPDDGGTTRVQFVSPTQPALVPQSAYDVRIQGCTAVGVTAVTVTNLRDAGVPLTYVLQRLITNATDKSVAQFMQTLFLDIYSKSYWDPAYARRQAETQCLTTLMP